MGTLTYYDPITGQWITTDDEETGGGVELYDGIIETRYIADLAVTDPKIASVSTSKLVGTISGTILDDNSIAWSKLDIAGVGYDQLDPGLSQDIFDTQQTADGAHALAMGRNNIYYSETEPTAPIVGDDFNHGDMWVNLGDGKKLYVYDGTDWVIAQDEDIGNLQIDLSATASRVALSANGVNKVYTQATMPTGGVYGIGDTWFAPDGKIYIFNGEIWYHNPVTNPDGSLPIGDTGLDAYYQNTQPTGGIYLIGDKWFDTDDNYQQYTYTRDGWRTTADAYTAMAAVDTVLTVANGKNKVVYSQNAPTGTGFVNGDMWYRTGTNETTGDTGVVTLYIYENGWKTQTLTDSVLGNITASRITVGVLNGNLIQANTLMGDRIKTNTLDASKILAGSITADSAIFAEGAIRSAWIGEAQIDTAHISSIDSNKITASWLEAGNIKAGGLSANVIDVASLQVGSIAAQWGNALDISSNTAITVLARKDDLISYINVAPEGIVINGDKIDINGALTFSNWADSNDVTKIDGGSIAANSITVNKVAAGFGQALDISSNTSITSRVTSTQLNTAIQNLVADIDVQYYLSTSAVTPTGGTWQSTAPPFEEGKYMWSRTKTTYQSGNISYEPSENGSMLSGATGQPGVGIQSIQEEYYSSTSATELAGGSWSTTVPAWNSNRWIWTRSKINYTDGSSHTTNEVNSSGSQGPAGAPGAAGVSALNAILSNEATTVPASSTGTVSTYNGSGTNINLYEGVTELSYDGVGTANGSWKVTAAGTGITPSTPTDGGMHAVYGNHSNMTADLATIVYTITGKRANGTAFSFTKTQTLTKSKAGAAGSQGIQGPSGDDGQSLYTWVKYADSPTTGMSDSPAGKTYIGLAYNKTSPTESTAYGDYTWSLIKGADGSDGAQGPKGEDGQTTYTWIRYADDQAGGGITTDPTGKSFIGFAYNKTMATGTNTATDYAWSKIRGDDGTSAVVGTLSNDAAVVPASSAGAVSTFAGAVTTMSVFIGSVDDSANWTYTQSASGGTFTASNSNRTATATAMTADVATVTITASKSGYSSISNTFTVTKAKAGTNGSTGGTGPAGQDATAYWLVVDTAAIGKSTTGTFTPSTITMTAKSQVGTNTPANYAGRFTVETLSGSTWTSRYSGTVNESTRTYTGFPADMSAIRVRLYLAGGQNVLLDEEMIPVVNDGVKGDPGLQGDPGPSGADGKPAIVGTLSNDSAVVPASSAGAVLSTAGAATTMSVYEGPTDVSSSWTFAQSVSGGTFTASGTPANRSAQLATMTADTATVTITASKSGYSNISSTFTVTKAKAGTNGSAGQNATAYWLVSDAAAISKSLAGAYTPSSVVLTAKTQVGTGAPANYSGRFIIATTTNGTTWTDVYTSSANEATRTYAVPAGIVAVRARLYLAGGTTNLLDEEVIPVVSDGPTGSPGSPGSPGTNGKVASIVPSAQVFKSSDGGKTFDMATITLTPQLQVVTYQGWDYWNGTAWTAITSGTNGFTISGNVLTVPHTSPLFTTTNTSLTFRLRSNDANVYDTVTIAKLYDVADLQIGGKNIVVDSGYMFPSESSNFNTVGTGYTLLIDPGEFYGDNASLRVTGASAGSTSNKFRHLLYGEGMVGRNMVLSFFVKGSVAATGSVLTEGMTTSLGTRTFPVTTSWTRVVLDMGSVTAAGTLDLNYLSMWFSAIGTFYLNSIKLEYGNKETEWSIAPQDMESQLSGLSGRIASAEQVITSDAIISRVRDTSWYQADLSGKATTGDIEAINTLLTNNYSTIEQTSSAISLQFGQLDSRISDVETTTENVKSSFTFGANGLLIAKSDSAFKVEITNNALNFLQGTTPIAWVNGNSMYITDATITNSLKIGAHTVSSENGITTFRLA